MLRLIAVSLFVFGFGAGEVIVETAQTRVPTGYIVELPTGYDSTRRYPLVVALHGYGDRMESYVGTNRQLCPEGAIGLYPEAVYPVHDQESEGGPRGWSWWLWADSTSWASEGRTREAATDWVLDVIATVSDRYAVDRKKVFVFGFSQGGAMTMQVGLRRPDLFAGLLPAGFMLYLEPGSELDPAVSGLPVRMMFGARDELIEPGYPQTVRDTLLGRGVPAELLSYPMGHTLSQELYDDARDFLWCILHREDRLSLSSLLYPEEAMFPAERNEQLLGVLCAEEPNAEVEKGLLAIYEQEPVEVKERIIYLLGARRCHGAEEFLRRVLRSADGISAAPSLRRAAYSALIKLGTNSAWETVEETEMEVAIRQVAPGSQAERVGLQPGDVLVSYNGTELGEMQDLRTARDGVAEGIVEIVMVVRRDGKEQEVRLSPGQIGIWTFEIPK
jgi:phospholipase/carboxylesterase